MVILFLNLTYDSLNEKVFLKITIMVFWTSENLPKKIYD